MLHLAVIGYPLKHTLSPLMHNCALKEMSIDGIYLPFEVKPADLKGAAKGFASLGYRGYNVTIPYKVDIIEYLDNITEEAKLAGAVNTVIIDKNGNSLGDNTDIYGFISTFSEEDKNYLYGKSVAVLGAGGASRAICAGLIQLGLNKINLYDINIDNAINTSMALKQSRETKVEISANSINNIDLTQISLLINANPVGMYPNIDKCAIDEKLLADLDPNAIIFDLIYRPRETLLLNYAKKYGYKTYNGSEMLVFQGAMALKKWVQRPVPVNTMRTVLLDALNK